MSGTARTEGERGEGSPWALHLALWIPFVALVIVSWFTVVAPELASDRPEDAGARRAAGARSQE